MKHLRILISLLFFTQVMVAQDINECRKIVEITVESINKGSSEGLNIYLADDFTIADQKGEIAKMVLKQLFLNWEKA